MFHLPNFLVINVILKSIDFISDDENLEGINTYVYMKVKTIFDPPLNSAVLASMKELISEFEWRINNEAEGY